MKRVASAAAVVLVLVGCWWLFLRPVPLLTGIFQCFVNNTGGQLVVDPTNGTAIIETGSTVPVTVGWPSGFTGRRVGSEVEVLDPQGTVVAVTGHNYWIGGAYARPASVGSFPGVPASGAWLTCGDVTPQP
jgi:hypothetical protein